MSHKKQLIRSEADPLYGKGSLSPLYEEQIWLDHQHNYLCPRIACRVLPEPLELIKHVIYTVQMNGYRIMGKYVQSNLSPINFANNIQYHAKRTVFCLHIKYKHPLKAHLLCVCLDPFKSSIWMQQFKT
jgi:hypothetical protein